MHEALQLSFFKFTFLDVFELSFGIRALFEKRHLLLLPELFTANKRPGAFIWNREPKKRPLGHLSPGGDAYSENSGTR